MTKLYEPWHYYFIDSHDMDHAPNSWCAMMWCPVRNTVRRLRSKHISVRQAAGMIKARIAHDDIARFVDFNETVICITDHGQQRSFQAAGTYPSQAAHARAAAGGRSMRDA